MRRADDPVGAQGVVPVRPEVASGPSQPLGRSAVEKALGGSGLGDDRGVGEDRDALHVVEVGMGDEQPDALGVPRASTAARSTASSS